MALEEKSSVFSLLWDFISCNVHVRVSEPFVTSLKRLILFLGFIDRLETNTTVREHWQGGFWRIWDL